MTDKTLKRLIDRLNQNKTDGKIFIRPLTSVVSFAKIWDDKPKPTDNICSQDGPYSCYFIKDEKGMYVAIVLDMSSNLHWFVLPKYRGKGHLTKALKETILPHLFQSEREVQRITIDENAIGEENFVASRKIAESLKFTLMKTENGESEYNLNYEDFQNDFLIEGQDSKFTEEQMVEMKKKINFLARSLWVIRTEIEMKLGESNFTEDLKETIKEIKSYVYKIDDLCFD